MCEDICETLLIDSTTGKRKGIPWVLFVWNLLIFLSLCLCVCSVHDSFLRLLCLSHSLTLSSHSLSHTHLCRMATQNKEYDFFFKVVLFGDWDVGKTCLLSRFTDDSFTLQPLPTIGVDYKIRSINIDGKVIKTQIWDTGIYSTYIIIEGYVLYNIQVHVLHVYSKCTYM